MSPKDKVNKASAARQPLGAKVATNETSKTATNETNETKPVEQKDDNIGTSTSSSSDATSDLSGHSGAAVVPKLPTSKRLKIVSSSGEATPTDLTQEGRELSQQAEELRKLMNPEVFDIGDPPEAETVPDGMVEMANDGREGDQHVGNLAEGQQMDTDEAGPDSEEDDEGKTEATGDDAEGKRKAK